MDGPTVLNYTEWYSVVFSGISLALFVRRLRRDKRVPRNVVEARKYVSGIASLGRQTEYKIIIMIRHTQCLGIWERQRDETHVAAAT